MKKLLITLLAFVSFIIQVQAVTAEALWQKANQLYLKKDYAGALAVYDSLLTKGYKNPELFYNAGNAAYKCKDMGHAVLYLEKAHLLKPADEDIAFNLKLVNLHLVDKIDEVPQLFFIRWWQHYIAWFSPNTWILLCIALLFLFAAFLAIYYIGKQYNRNFIRAAVISLLLALLLGYTGIKSHAVLYQDDYGVVMPSNITIKAAPDPSAVDLFPLHEGLKVQLKEEVNGWRKIRISDGKEGWCTKDCVEAI